MPLNLLILTCALAQTATEPPHLSQAQTLVNNLKGATLNVYGGGKRHIDWDAGQASARTVCSSFATLLLEHTYGYTAQTAKDWLGTVNPKASAYHDAIVGHRGFKQIVHVTAILPGDFLAVKFNDHHLSGNGEEDTGHVMLVEKAPVQTEDKPPSVPSTHQYLVAIIDSTAKGHGFQDSRVLSTGKFTGGIGRGTMRIYADDKDRIAGYTWSRGPTSKFYNAPDRDLVVGRLDPARLPKK